MSIKKKLLNGFLWSFVDKIINQLGLLIITMYLANELGPSAFGLIGMLNIFILLSDSLVSSGFSQALVQRSHRVTESELSTVFIINVVLGFFIYLILCLLTPHIAAFYSQPELESISKVLFFVIVINSFSVVSRAKLIINVDFKSQTKANFGGNLFGGCIALILVNKGYGYWSLVAMTLMKSFVITVVLFFYSKWKPRLIFCVSDFKKLFSFGSKLLVAGLIATGANNLYTILIGRYFNAQQVGFYSQGAYLTNTLSGVITSVLQGVTYPVMTELNSDHEKLRTIYSRILRVTMIVTFPIMFGFIGISDLFTKLFLGEEWISIIPIIILLSLSRMLTPISAINMNILNAIGRSDLFLKVDLLKIPLVLLSILVSAPFGIEAVAVANLLTTIVAFFINSYYPGKLFNLGFYHQLKFLIKPFVASLLMLATLNFVNLENIWFELILKVIVGVFSYFAIMVVLRDDEFSLFVKKIVSLKRMAS